MIITLSIQLEPVVVMLEADPGGSVAEVIGCLKVESNHNHSLRLAFPKLHVQVEPLWDRNYFDRSGRRVAPVAIERLSNGKRSG